MKATAPLLAAAALLAGCAGPRPADLTASLDAYRTHPGIFAIMPDLPGSEFTDATLLSAGDCGAMGAYFICDARFRLKDGRELEADLWLIRLEGQWRLQNIVPKEQTQ